MERRLGGAVGKFAALVVSAAAWMALAAVPASAQTPVPAPAPNVVPVASFTSTPARPLVGETVTFTSTSTDSDGTIVHEAWDLDGDGVNDATGHTAVWTYAQGGPHAVRLRARDNAGATTAVKVVVLVTAPNRPPVAAFDFAPAAPVAGQPITFTSLSSDPDGLISALAWDLDADGRFTDATGGRAVWTFPAAGRFVVAIRATDNTGASSVSSQTLTVRGAGSAQDALPAPQPGNSAPETSPPGPTPSPGTAAPKPGTLVPGIAGSLRSAPLISPFPVVRIRGHAAGSDIVIDLLSVRAPRGATVTVRCSRPGCPRRRMTAHAVSAARPLRLRTLERRYASGAVLEVYISRRGHVGKYVRFTMRRGRAPERTDRCLDARGTQPIPCPAQ
jgi:PKD repeat protein